VSEPENPRGASPGPSTDRDNRPVVDPTRNVLDLVDAAVKRQDDLRDMEGKHRDQLDVIRAQHNRELREAESARIDAIRAVDVGAVNRAAEVAATQALTLATQVATSAETLRTQVQAAATASTVALAAALEPVQKDIADLRRAQYEAQGQKAQVVEAREGIGSTTQIIGAIVAVIIVAITLYALRSKPATPIVVTPTPVTTTTTTP
jgi:hypothetical protein